MIDPRNERPRPAKRDPSADSIGYKQAMDEAKAAQEAAAQITAAFPNPAKPIFIRMRKTGVRLEVNFETALHALLRNDCELSK